MDSPTTSDRLVIGELSRRRIDQEEQEAADKRAAKRSRKAAPTTEPEPPADEKEVTP